MLAYLSPLLLANLLWFAPGTIAGHCGVHGNGMFKCCQWMDSTTNPVVAHQIGQMGLPFPGVMDIGLGCTTIKPGDPCAEVAMCCQPPDLGKLGVACYRI
ncbi:hypothetical protein HYDPIDRAFT_104278 [Hydnomerulius pinastri MD-312]|nr:hypothetical protein HYDPIDRAFT_104278 [Hydnomerulius pinastri MD-312]